MDKSLKVIARKFKKPVTVASLQLEQKMFYEGVVDGFPFEATVLPGLHHESFEFVKNEIDQFFASETAPQSSAACFAIEAWQAKATAKQPEINALLIEPNISELHALRQQNLRSFKFKIGRGESTKQLLDCLATLNENESVRLDGNQHFSADSLKAYLEELRPFWQRIEYIEEPFQSVSDFEDYDLPLPIALDERLPLYLAGELSFEPRHIVLKPALFGFLRSQTLIAALNAKGIKVTISSCYEGPIGMQGLYALSHLQNQHQPNPAGLDTLRAFVGP